MPQLFVHLLESFRAGFRERARVAERLNGPDDNQSLDKKRADLEQIREEADPD
jgi:hypothetical protein